MLGETRGQAVMERLCTDLNADGFKPGDRIPAERELMVRYSPVERLIAEVDAFLRQLHGAVPTRILPQRHDGPEVAIVG